LLRLLLGCVWLEAVCMVCGVRVVRSVCAPCACGQVARALSGPKGQHDSRLAVCPLARTPAAEGPHHPAFCALARASASAAARDRSRSACCAPSPPCACSTCTSSVKAPAVVGTCVRWSTCACACKQGSARAAQSDAQCWHRRRRTPLALGSTNVCARCQPRRAAQTHQRCVGLQRGLAARPGLCWQPAPAHAGRPAAQQQQLLPRHQRHPLLLPLPLAWLVLVALVAPPPSLPLPLHLARLAAMRACGVWVARQGLRQGWATRTAHAPAGCCARAPGTGAPAATCCRAPHATGRTCGRRLRQQVLRGPVCLQHVALAPVPRDVALEHAARLPATCGVWWCVCVIFGACCSGAAHAAAAASMRQHIKHDALMTRTTNQPANQPSKQASKLPTNQPTNQARKHAQTHQQCTPPTHTHTRTLAAAPALARKHLAALQRLDKVFWHTTRRGSLRVCVCVCVCARVWRAGEGGGGGGRCMGVCAECKGLRSGVEALGSNRRCCQRGVRARGRQAQQRRAAPSAGGARTHARTPRALLAAMTIAALFSAWSMSAWN
jgi:hypothetical protein